MRLILRLDLLCALLALAAGQVAHAQQASAPANCAYAWAGAALGSCAAKSPMQPAAQSGFGAKAPDTHAASALTPMPGYALNKNWSVGGTAGNGTGMLYGREGLDRNYLDSNYTGAYLDSSHWFGRSQVATRFSLVRNEARLSGFGLGAGYLPDYRSNWSQAAATASYGYYFDNFMPYASLTVASDLNRPAGMPGVGREAWIPRVGVDFFSRRNLSGGVSYSAEQGSAVKNEVWSANLNYRF